VVALRGEDDVFKIETLYPLVETLERLSGRSYNDQPVPFRVVADHLRAATFAIADGALPGKTEANYVVRRLIRRAIRHGHDLGIRQNFCTDLSGVVIDLFCDIYPNLVEQREKIAGALELEENNFKETLERGLKKAQRISEAVLQASRESGAPAQISGADAFNLYETDGFPLELTVELAREQGLSVDTAGFVEAYAQHREDSKKAAEQGRFKSGLADHSLETTRLHTASHLLQAALRRVLGPSVKQRGSNITAERLRFDFSHHERLSEEQLAEVERLVNEQIARNLPVTMETMPLQQALDSGALAFFSERYAEQVKVYTIGNFSREVCNGPHVSHTGELGQFKILKQEAVGQGIRRIRATVEA
jgi:alanyl-tRNA synthetase